MKKCSHRRGRPGRLRRTAIIVTPFIMDTGHGSKPLSPVTWSQCSSVDDIPWYSRRAALKITDRHEMLAALKMLV